MKRTILLIILTNVFVIHYGQIIADHTKVDKFQDIPQQYIDEVKKMWLVVAGESHSAGYRAGLVVLETLYPAYAASVTESGTPEAYTTSHLRASRATWGDIDHSSGWIYSYGEEDWCCFYDYPTYTYNPAAVARTKAGITYSNTHSLNISAIGFGHCYDDGENLYQSYLRATQEYVDYCSTNGYSTKVFFTTGPIDDYMSSGAAGYEQYLKWEHIRDYIDAHPSSIFFDYADILSYNDDGQQETASWDGHTYPVIHPDNLEGDYTGGHIGTVGALRLAKATWWMLARIAGWDGGETTTIPVTAISVSGTGGATTITSDKGTLQLSAVITPSNATDKTVTWSIENGTGQASISDSGLVTAISNGTVTAKATANDGSGVFGTLTIAISNQIIPVIGITVTGAGGTTTILSDNGTLQLNVNITPFNATNKSVIWSIQNGTGQASINASGLVTAISKGTVTAKVTSAENAEISDILVITILEQSVMVQSIEVYPADNQIHIIDTKNGTMQFVTNIIPKNASDTSVEWTVVNQTGTASVDTYGMVTAIANGFVNVKAMAKDGSNVSGSCLISISNQEVVTNLNETPEVEYFIELQSDHLIVMFKNESIPADLCSIYSMQGILVYSQKISSIPIDIDVSAYPTGIYFVSFSDGSKIKPIKILIN